MLPTMLRRLLLVDLFAEAFRIHHGFGDNRLMSSHGEDTTVLYGIVNNLCMLLLADPKPTHVALVQDAPGKTFRYGLSMPVQYNIQLCVVITVASAYTALFKHMIIHTHMYTGMSCIRATRVTERSPLRVSVRDWSMLPMSCKHSMCECCASLVWRLMMSLHH